MELKNEVESRGFKVIGAGAFPVQHSIVRQIGMSRPNKADLKVIADFGIQLNRKLRNAVDFNNVDISVIGQHKMNKFSAIFEANFLRLVKLFLWVRGKHIDVVFSNGYLPALVGYYKNIRRYTFDDDPQTFDYKPKLKYSTQSSYCIYSGKCMAFS